MTVAEGKRLGAEGSEEEVRLWTKLLGLRKQTEISLPQADGPSHGPRPFLFTKVRIDAKSLFQL